MANGIKFQEINVDEDKAAAEEMVRKSGQRGIPVTEIDGDIIIGFDRQRLAKLLGIQE